VNYSTNGKKTTWPMKTRSVVSLGQTKKFGYFLKYTRSNLL